MGQAWNAARPAGPRVQVAEMQIAQANELDQAAVGKIEVTGEVQFLQGRERRR